MGDQDVSVRRDCVFPRVLSSRVRERMFGIGQWRLWCAVDIQGAVVGGQIEYVRRVLEVFERLSIQGVLLLVGEAQGGTAGRVEIGVVVSCCDRKQRMPTSFLRQLDRPRTSPTKNPRPRKPTFAR